MKSKILKAQKQSPLFESSKKMKPNPMILLRDTIENKLLKADYDKLIPYVNVTNGSYINSMIIIHDINHNPFGKYHKMKIEVTPHGMIKRHR